MSHFFGLKTRLLVGFLLSFWQYTAWANIASTLPAARAVTHTAADPLDSRYEGFFPFVDSDDSLGLTEAPTQLDAAPAPQPVAHAPASGALAKLRTFFDFSPAYKAVRQHVHAAAERYDIDVELLQAVIMTESGFNAHAVSPRGAVGLMQLMPRTAAQYGVAARPRAPIARQLTDPSTNIGAGARYLRYLLDMFPGKVDLAVAAYNAGEGSVQRAGNRIPKFRETQKYVKNVMQIYRTLQSASPSGTELAAQVPGRVRVEFPAPVVADATLAVSDVLARGNRFSPQ